MLNIETQCKYFQFALVPKWLVSPFRHTRTSQRIELPGSKKNIILLDRDNLSHFYPMGPFMWTHLRGTHGLRPTNP